MASLNLSANGPSISKSYQSVVNSSMSKSARGFSAFAKWAIFSVSTPLVSAFQQDAGNKESVLKVQDTGEGELADLIDEFSEGKIQFAFVKITDANTGLPKNVFIAWCGEGVPERTKGYFTSHLSTVSKFLHGYHVQITARSDADLTVDAIIQKVGDASGSKYTPGPERPTASVPKPPLSSKPVFTPLRTGGINTGTADTAQVPLRVKSNDDDDGWGPDAPPVTRTNLEKVQPAYQPTRVNIQELRSEKQAVPTVKFSSTTHQHHDVVKGGYQPIGKVDIAAIRNQAREAGNLKDDRPEPVKGAYEPVGKVDIAAIRAKAHKTNEDAVNAKESPAVPDESSSSTANPDFTQSSRLKSLPKPKVSNRFGGSSTFLGTKPPLPGDSASSATSPAAPIGSASRTFADQGGKTPAQLWAERKAKERGHDPTAIVASSDTAAPTVQNQLSGGEWKSSYSGKSWAPVQTTHTGRSVESSRNEAMVSVPVERPNPEPIAPQQSVSTIRDQLMQGPPKETSSFVEPTESASFPVDTTGFEASRATQPSETPTAQPSPPGSPAPDLTGESSPIRVAVPVSKEVVDDNEGQIPFSTTEYMGTPQQGLSDDKGQTNNVRDASLVSDGATPAGGARIGELRALVHYDYEKAEDNEIDLKEGEYVTEIEMVDKDWWLGLNARGDRGLFPSNYVEVIEDDYQSRTEYDTQPATNAHAAETVAVSTQASSSRDKPTAKALYDYEAAEDNELSFPEDAEITNIEFPDDDWWLGQYHGKTGLFPANYVQLAD